MLLSNRFEMSVQACHARIWCSLNLSQPWMLWLRKSLFSVLYSPTILLITKSIPFVSMSLILYRHGSMKLDQKRWKIRYNFHYNLFPTISATGWWRRPEMTLHCNLVLNNNIHNTPKKILLASMEMQLPQILQPLKKKCRFTNVSWLDC